MNDRLSPKPTTLTATSENANRFLAGKECYVFPVSFAQQRLWFLEQLDGASALYNVPAAFELLGELDWQALERSVAALVARHEALRTTFVLNANEPMQVVAERLPVPIEREERLGASDEQVQGWLNAASREVFDLERGPLLRVKLLRLDEARHVLLLVMHHIVSDGWSMGVLFRELSALYAGDCKGVEAVLPALDVQYADYAVWQREWLTGDVLEGQLAYWRERLHGAPEALELPADRARPAVAAHRGGRAVRIYADGLCAQLKALGQAQGCTLYMVLLAAFEVLLHRYTGSEDVVVGSPVAGRTRTELEGLTGFFVNTLVLRGDLSGAPSFAQALARVREVALEAYAHQEVPFEKLVEVLRPHRDLSRAPLFQVMFVLQNAPRGALTLGEVEARSLAVDTGTAKFDLTLSMTEQAGGLAASFEYDAGLFEAATIERLAEHFEVLLTSIVSNPGQRIDALPLLTETERLQLLIEWNDTATSYPEDATVHALFEAQVARTPEALAVTFADQSLSYGELNVRANRLAHRLQALGVGPEVLVGICVERSLEMVIGLLAILKAGGAYVPLDPSYPKARLAYMLEDTGAPVLLTQSTLLEALPAHSAEVVCLDNFDWADPTCPSTNPASASTPRQLAYVIYTSGSTGTPKGVMIPLKAISRLVLKTDYIQIRSGDVVAQTSNASFDAATFEIWGPLLNGATMVVIDKETALEPEQFARVLEYREVSIMFLTTALFNLLVEVKPEALGGVRCLLFGGEVVDPRWVRQLLNTASPRRLLHVYGPTESTTFSTWYEVEAVAEDATTVPIGRPLANTETYILDPNRQPVPIGVPGELYIGGAGLARGYLNQPALTAEAFISHPFEETPNARLYKTGDLVRYRLDGAIEFLGRLDNQVKLRGFRIEPGEIETTLNGHPEVAHCVVVLQGETPESRRLVAYVVAADGAALRASELREWLKRTLPDYMAVAAFVVLDALPLTPNGKVDRRALPVPVDADWVLKEQFVEPRDALERELAEIWAEVLGVARIGIHDDFFAAGGHSLLAVQLMDRIHQRTGVDIHLNTLWYEGATIAFLANRIRNPKEALKRSSLVPMRPSGARRPLFCVHTIGGSNLFHYDELVCLLDSERPVYGLRAQGVDDGKQPHIDVASMAHHCIDSMREVQPHGPYLLCCFSSAGAVGFEMAQQLRADGDRVELLALIDCMVTGRISTLRSYVGLLFRLMRERRWREIQERVYHATLTKTGLHRFRRLESLGESHRWAYWNYLPKPYPDDALLFKANQSPHADDESHLGWANLIDGDLCVEEVDTTHGMTVKHPAVRIVAERLQARLDRVHSGSSTMPASVRQVDFCENRRNA